MIKGTGNRKRKCKACEKESRAHEGYIAGVNFVCDSDCAYELMTRALDKGRSKQKQKDKQSQAEEEKRANKAHRERLNGIKPIKEWQDKLQKLVNQYVIHIRDKDKPCCTCGTTAPDIKYDAGHYRTRKAAPELRYELTNIHIQCSQQCNVFGSGMRSEYREFIEAVYGTEHLDWLDGDHGKLKDKFPHWSDYDNEIKRYRKLIRSHGLTPAVQVGGLDDRQPRARRVV